MSDCRMSSTLFMSMGVPGSSLMNQAMAVAAAWKWGLFHLPMGGDLKTNSWVRRKSSMKAMAAVLTVTLWWQ